VTLARRMFFASVVLALIVAAAFAALIFAVSAQRDAVAREVRSREVTAAAQRLETLIFDMETGVRGFVIAGTDVYLEPYVDARKELPSGIAALQTLVANDPAQKKRAIRLVGRIRDYRDYTRTLIDLVRAEPGVTIGEFDLFVLGQGKLYTDEIRRDIDTFLTNEERLAALAAEDAERRSDLAVIVGAVGLGASTALIVLFGVYLARAVGRPVRSVAHGASRLAAGELTLRLREEGPGEIGELTRSFNEMAERLEQNRAALEQQNEELRESERMKTELVNIVSHELRTPLASVLGFTALLLKREFDPPARRHYLGIIDAQARRLAALLEDFLDVQRIEHQGLELSAENVDLASLLDEQAQLYAAQSPKHRLEVALADRPLQVRGDPNRLAQVVGNLLSNAIKYSPEGGVVELAAMRHDGEVRVSVRDEGLGIPSDQQERIFTKFFRGDAAATGITGTGLGLAVSREIVEAHGGRIGFDSDPGTGSTFWVELPEVRGERGMNTITQGAT
jgi:signal transduction histidine kinase